MSTATPIEALTAKQEEGLIALLNEPTVKKAAESIGVDQKTIHRWLEQPAFAAAYRKARREAFSQAMATSQRYAPMALQALAKIVMDESKPPSARVSAASAILKFSRESLELDDLATRLDAVEAQVRGDPPPAPAPHSLPPAPVDPEPIAEAA
jgi:hypothetical protein